jgi:methylglyoxal synthase
MRADNVIINSSRRILYLSSMLRYAQPNLLYGGICMEIAIIAHDLKKELMAQFCIAYCGILSKHNLCATAVTAKYISEATGLKIDKLMSGEQGGEQQIASRISYNEIDVLLFFRDTRATNANNPIENELLRMCDLYNVPVATNIATAEVIITALDRGDLDWRELVNPHSALNKK